jgi:hypothetical protein
MPLRSSFCVPRGRLGSRPTGRSSTSWVSVLGEPDTGAVRRASQSATVTRGRPPPTSSNRAAALSTISPFTHTVRRLPACQVESHQCSSEVFPAPRGPSIITFSPSPTALRTRSRMSSRPIRRPRSRSEPLSGREDNLKSLMSQQY